MNGMKKGGGMCFWPTPIMHLAKPPYDGLNNFVIIKSCGCIAMVGFIVMTL
jgi:hypothetical protein